MNIADEQRNRRMKECSDLMKECSEKERELVIEYWKSHPPLRGRGVIDTPEIKEIREKSKNLALEYLRLRDMK